MKQIFLPLRQQEGIMDLSSNSLSEPQDKGVLNQSQEWADGTEGFPDEKAGEESLRGWLAWVTLPPSL